MHKRFGLLARCNFRQELFERGRRTGSSFRWKRFRLGLVTNGIRFSRRLLGGERGRLMLDILVSRFFETRCAADTTEHLACNKRSEEHTSELQSRGHLVCRLLLEKKNFASFIRTLPM